MDTPVSERRLLQLTREEQINLWRRAEAGDTAADDALFSYLGKIATRTLQKRYRDVSVSQYIDDAVQDAAVRWERSQYNPSRAQPSTWYTQLAIDALRDLVKKERRAKDRAVRAAARQPEDAVQPAFDEKEWLAVRNAIDALSPVQREVFLGRVGLRQTSAGFEHRAEETFVSLEVRLGLKSRSAERRYKDALKHLRSVLGPTLSGGVVSEPKIDCAGEETP